MVAHQFTDDADSLHNIRYNLVFSVDSRDVIPLPAPALFDSIARGGYRVMLEDSIAYRNDHAAAEGEPQEWDAQVPAPQHFHVRPDGYYGW
jgi:hypothetical protein